MHSRLLALLTALFALRVIGQVLVEFYAVGWLPPSQAWASGLIPYPALLVIQLALLTGMVKIVADVARERMVRAAKTRLVAFSYRLQRGLCSEHGGALHRHHDTFSRNALAGRRHPDFLSLRVGGISLHLRPPRWRDCAMRLISFLLFLPCRYEPFKHEHQDGIDTPDWITAAGAPFPTDFAGDYSSAEDRASPRID